MKRTWGLRLVKENEKWFPFARITQILITFVATTNNWRDMATNKNVEFEAIATRGCGLDVHKVEIVATVEGEGFKRETRAFKSTTRSLTELKEWLLSLPYEV